MFTVEQMPTHRFIIYLFRLPKDQRRAAAGLTLTYNQITFEPMKWMQGIFFASARCLEGGSNVACGKDTHQVLCALCLPDWDLLVSCPL